MLRGCFRSATASRSLFPSLSPWGRNVIHNHLAAGFFVRTESTPNEHALMFLPDGAEVLGEGTRQFSSFRDTYGSPLARDLFMVEGVTGVLLGPDFISVNKDAEEDWAYLKPQIFAAIADFYASGQAVVTEDNKPPADTEVHPDDDEVVAQIKELLDTRVRPRVQDDGGDLEYRGFVDGVVLVKLKGACVGCGSSTITLKNGVERLLQYYIPEVEEVMEVEEDEEGEEGVAQF